MENNTLPEQIANQLRRKILLGQMNPGASIKERDNAAALGVSRTPMREAIRILAREGLIQLRPLRSPIVADPTLKDVTDDLHVMTALEVLAGELACQNATDQELEEIGVLHERMLDAATSDDIIARFEVDMAFHRAIALAAHNSSLARTHEAYMARLWRVRFLSSSQADGIGRIIQQHGEIYRGLQDRNEEEVAAVLRKHVRQIIPNISGVYSKRSGARAARL
jgi:DNA-binding GntR family transcriptional regulator